MKTTRKIALFLRKIGIEGGVTRILEGLHLSMQNIKVIREDWVHHPTREMLDSRKFFKEHAKEVEEVLSFLADEKSRDVYTRTIKYRQTYDKRDTPEYSVREQYFPKDILKLTDQEVFIDCGAYDGDTFRLFCHKTEGNYRKYVAFEADSLNYEYLKKKTQKNKNLVVLNCAVWDKDEELSFVMDGSPGSEISNAGNVKVIGRPIDGVSECKDASFIKMDIEGAERHALNGAVKTIQRNYPKLAICIYHSDEDMVYLPKWIHEHFPNYDLYIRHHHYLPIETVVYAIPRSSHKGEQEDHT